MGLVLMEPQVLNENHITTSIMHQIVLSLLLLLLFQSVRAFVELARTTSIVNFVPLYFYIVAMHVSCFYFFFN